MTLKQNGRHTAGSGGTMTADDALSSRLLDALQDHAVFAVDAGGSVASWSEAAQRLTGLTAADILHRPCELFLHGDTTIRWRLHLRGEGARGVYHGESWWRRTDGDLVRVEETVQPLEPEGFVVVARRLDPAPADRQLREAGDRETAGLNREHSLRSELRAADRRAAFLAEASSILVATSLDFDSTVSALARLTVSRLAEWCVVHTLDEGGALRLSNTAHRDPEVEARLEAILPDELDDGWEQAIRTVIGTGHPQLLEHAMEPHWFRRDASPEDQALLERLTGGAIMATPLLGRGRILGAITFAAGAGREFSDEDLILAEELGRRAAIALDNARLFREAQEANRAKADFLAVISHELRTPLNAIMGYSDLLDAEISGNLSDRQRRQVDRIRASARHLLQLIEEILAFASIQAGGDEVSLEEVDVADLMGQAAAVAEPMARARELEFNLHLPAEPATVRTDLAKARQVLVNLLSNAVKFTERGSVTLACRVGGGRVTFDVMDTGIGIPADQLERIYEPFQQVERPNTRRTGGTGLGLTVSRRYARLLRGELQVRSQPGRGSTFSFVLPVQYPAATRVAKTRSRHP
jgi:PAS domain S-box-containing protein